MKKEIKEEDIKQVNGGQGEGIHPITPSSVMGENIDGVIKEEMRRAGGIFCDIKQQAEEKRG